MSKIGKMPVEIPSGTEVSFDGAVFSAKGGKGSVSVPVVENIDIKIEDGKVVVSPKDDKAENAIAYWGLIRSLVNNAVEGVSEGFTRELELVGVGYRVEEIAKGIKLSVGYSHPVEVEAPEGIEFEIIENNIKITGADKQVVGQLAANIRSIRKPEPYKGKGIKYKEEIVKRKQGKTAKAATA